MKIRVEISSLATPRQSGVSAYTRLLTRALAKDTDSTIYGHYFNFLRRQPDPQIDDASIVFKRSSLFPLRVYAKLQSFRIAPAFDVFLPKADLTIFPNFATWPTVKSKLRATVIHDLTYLYFPDVVEKKNLAHLRRVVPRSIKQADFIITVSESVKAELVQEFNLNPECCVVTTIPPDSMFYKKSGRKVHDKYGIPTEKYIYFIGTLEPRKNLSTLLEAYLKLPYAIRKDYSLILAGSQGWRNEALRRGLQEAEESGENVRHIGFVDQADSPALYQNASLFVMPSIYEGFGMPVLEAMASNTPIVAADIPVLREVGGDAALYANPYEAGDFREKILSILSSENVQKNLKDKTTLQLQKFSWEDNTRVIIDYAESLLSNSTVR